jgi:hypothetical protein
LNDTQHCSSAKNLNEELVKVPVFPIFKHQINVQYLHASKVTHAIAFEGYALCNICIFVLFCSGWFAV